MILVGLLGYARSGKDTAGEFLVANFGFTRLAFADKLRDFAYAIDPLVTAYPYYDEWSGPSVDKVCLSTLVDKMGWEKAKEQYPEVRRLLQRIGTEGGREVLDQNVWVDATMKQVRRDSDKRYVITDVRFPNEVEAIKARGGVTWRVRRPGFDAVNGHPSETALDAWGTDHVFMNDGELLEFQAKVRYEAGRLISPDMYT